VTTQPYVPPWLEVAIPWGVALWVVVVVLVIWDIWRRPYPGDPTPTPEPTRTPPDTPAS
jgi:hypothetical protein